MLIVNINDDIQLLDFTIGFKLKYFQLNLRCLPNWNCLPITRMLKRLCNKSIFNFSGSENLLNNLTETILQDEYVALPPLIKVNNLHQCGRHQRSIIFWPFSPQRCT